MLETRWRLGISSPLSLLDFVFGQEAEGPKREMFEQFAFKSDWLRSARLIEVVRRSSRGANRWLTYGGSQRIISANGCLCKRI